MTLAKIKNIVLAVAALFIAISAYGQPSDSLQTATATNLDYADSFVYFVDSGASPTNICANAYVFAGPTLISCCSCLLTPNGLTSQSVINDLLAAPNSSVSIKVLSSTPAITNPKCDPTTPTIGTLSTGLRSWIVTFDTPSPSGGTEKVFQLSMPSASDLNSTAGVCKTAQTHGAHSFTNSQGCLCYQTVT